MATTETTASTRLAPLLSVLTGAVAGVLVGVALTATAPVSGVANVSEVVSVGLPVARVLLNVAAAATVGLGLLSVLVGYDRPRITEPVLTVARPAAVAAALLWALAALVTLVLRTAEYRPTDTAVSIGDIAGYAGAVAAGKALLIVAAFALVQVGVGILAVRRGERVPAEVRVGLGLFALLALPVTGHSSDWSLHDYTLISLELHVLAAITWVGGLGATAALLPANRVLLAHALPRFSRLATLCLLITAGTGVFNGVVQLALAPDTNLWSALFTTPYGILVLLKVVAAGTIAALGGYVRLKLLPSIVRHQRTALALWVTLELTVMGLALGFAVVLTRTPVA